jgi:hypothetical protein
MQTSTTLLLPAYAEWTETLAAFVAIVQQQRVSAKHVRVRTFERLQENFVDAQDDLWLMRGMWASIDERAGGSRIIKFMERDAQSFVLFLLLLRGRVAPAIPAEIWSMIVYNAAPQVERFRFTKAQALTINVRQIRAKPLPEPLQMAVLWQPNVLTSEDRSRLFKLACDVGVKMQTDASNEGVRTEFENASSAALPIAPPTSENAPSAALPIAPPTESSSPHWPVLPDELIVRIARLSGVCMWLSGWSKVSSKYRALKWLGALPAEREMGAPDVTMVPDDAPTINSAISAGHGLVLVRPGVYMESVRITADLQLIGLGTAGAVRVISQGWEPALVLGGFTVGRAKLRDGAYLAAASAGRRATVHNMSFAMRNQQQAVAVYCTSGQQSMTHCEVHGTVRVSGSAAAPTLMRCRIHGSRSTGLRICDHAGGRVSRCELVRNRLAAVRLSPCATPELRDNRFEGNGHDGMLCDAAPEAEASDDDDFSAWIEVGESVV